jgi:ATP-dependent Clp protease ATP-binding subunit ClpB
MDLDVTENALQKIAEAGYDPVYGARPLKRAVQQQIENPLSKQILEGRFGPKDTIRVDAQGNDLVFSKA